MFSLLPNFRLLHIFEIGAKFCFFWYPARPISKNFFKNSFKGRCYFFRRVKGQIRKKPLNISKNTFLQTSLRISRPNQKHMKHIEFLKKCQNHRTLLQRPAVTLHYTHHSLDIEAHSRALTSLSYTCTHHFLNSEAESRALTSLSSTLLTP
jgi:hypothetical protein